MFNQLNDITRTLVTNIEINGNVKEFLSMAFNSTSQRDHLTANEININDGVDNTPETQNV